MKKSIVLISLVFVPQVAFAHTDSDVHNALGLFGHPAAVFLLIASVGVLAVMRARAKKKKL
ncbi:MAG: hypothetical protein UV82_C0003G0004 [Candidatus Magasanikbacteria bacterium GW2011_GWD2_43_18]|uniref:Gram-positive cocci surface proteins LPxTG domain-containing protein n=1 Tax=Candidatus Magasanikbacteria bacterium GW2011_GWE2_42_7 TaxID=1619052 RepID=A0A0G1BFX2_9BACT|nr:MAG: hypothetical protein UV18_C0012G0012 [Candidatus Magasanikbacteria bacterium GW2011_GWC2_42_27]KKS72177.1 MAG: hypothetical protein UV42_C0012G0004 [Candidatus Magasanikbacteria bacterium GW2011_GWE2_42_7]KKT04905.1 MAG: hypothetical protein UV82_C0003G0004 [Candidatus Magasanikbacteria bacterium GW2011_GWD2_43_18]KKT25407.1 MAG: hypothetical protein UW10_C0008G0019 [Candidatus Magasanikbacteria bacterium GW2011_GWA2_43_9]HBB37817.1 hypothetical protein [Candidatus Magasanikbacteria bac